MRIALTGGTGFIGSHFLNQAHTGNHTVLAIRRSPNSKPKIKLDTQPIWLDRQLADVKAEDLQGYEILIHLAAHTANLPYDTLTNCLHWNLISTLSLFEQARLAGIRRYLVAGSCFEYGRSGERYKEIPSNAPLEPTNSYAASKAAASITLLNWAEENALSLEILRIFHVFGEGEPQSRLWPSLKNSALNGKDFQLTPGEQIRDFQPVEKVALAFLNRASSSETTIHPTALNLGTGNPLTIREFALKWWKHWNAGGSLSFGAIPYRRGEVMSYIPKVDIHI